MSRAPEPTSPPSPAPAGRGAAAMPADRLPGIPALLRAVAHRSGPGRALLARLPCLLPGRRTPERRRGDHGGRRSRGRQEARIAGTGGACVRSRHGGKRTALAAHGRRRLPVAGRGRLRTARSRPRAGLQLHEHRGRGIPERKPAWRPSTSAPAGSPGRRPPGSSPARWPCRTRLEKQADRGLVEPEAAGRLARVCPERIVLMGALDPPGDRPPRPQGTSGSRSEEVALGPPHDRPDEPRRNPLPSLPLSAAQEPLIRGGGVQRVARGSSEGGLW